MLETYKAKIYGDKIEWETDAPKILQKEESVAVYVTVIDESGASDLPNGEKMAEVLKKIASRGSFSLIENASEWQREQRRERDFAEREK